MSQENVEIVQRYYEAWNGGDMAAVGDFLDTAAVLRPAEGWPEPGPYVGRDTIMSYYQQLRDTWASDTAEATSDFLHGADRVAVRTVWNTVGQGPPSHLETTIVHTMRNGKIREIEFFWDHAEALEAVGLSEEATSHENVEQLYRQIIETWNARDLEAGVALIAKDVEISTAVGGMEGGYHGHEGIRRWWADFHDMFPDCNVSVLALRAIGDASLAHIRITGHAGEIGVPLDATMWHAMRWREGRVWRIGDRLSEAEALEAVGLSE